MTLPDVLPTTLLVVADSNFINICKEPDQYIKKLKDVIANRPGRPYTLVTIPGRYGISNLDNLLPLVPVQDKNKTVFTQTLENNALLFDELLVVSIAEDDNYINGAKEVMTTLNKSFTHYRYNRKGN